MISYCSRIAVLLSIAFSAAVSGKDYAVPARVEILSEAQIFGEFIGNTAANRLYSEYYEPPASGQMEGQLRGKHGRFGEYEGSWRIRGRLFCIEYYRRLMSALGDCYTVARVGEQTRIYRKDGYELYPDGGRLKVVPGNPENL